jgi:hypothetical protein
MANQALPYIGYGDAVLSDVSKISELIYRKRRQVAVASYLYYCLDESVISDHEYEYRVLKLIELQSRFPKISLSIPFMKKLFCNQDFSATGFHIGRYVKDSKSKDAISALSSAQRVLAICNREERGVFESEEVSKKIQDTIDRIDFITQK